MVVIPVMRLMGRDVLSGTPAGRELLSMLLRNIPDANEPTPVFLDFAGVSAATASFLRESILEYRRHVRGRNSNLYPVVANASDSIVDDLELLLRARSDALLCCDLLDSENPTNVRVIGKLEPKQELTFRAVQSAREADATTLAASSLDPDAVRASAWSNRLSGLVAKGLIAEYSHGRSKTYKVLLPH